MHDELDAHGLARIGRHVHRSIEPSLPIFTLVKDGLQDDAIGIGNISVLRIEGDGVGGVVPVPEAQNGVGRHRSKLLVERADPVWLGPANPARQHRERPAVRIVCGDYRRIAETVNCPGRETTGLESLVLDEQAIAEGCIVLVVAREPSIRITKLIGDRAGGDTCRQRASNNAGEIDRELCGHVVVNQLHVRYRGSDAAQVKATYGD